MGSFFLKALIVVFLVGTLFGCGRPSSGVKEEVAEEAATEQDADNQSFQVSEESKLPDCRPNREGSLAFVRSKNEFFSCESGEWKRIDLGVGVASSQQSCQIRRDGSLASIKCGVDSVSIQNGIASDGSACSVNKSGNLATITCGSSSVTIQDGLNGINGSAGAQGASGAQGPTGVMGVGCSVTKSGGIATVSCGSQNVQVFDGVAGQGCSVSKTGTVATVTCGGSSASIVDGATGAQGVQGYLSLLVMAQEASGSNCMGGGTRISSGIDNGDGAGVAGNGQLEPGEVDLTRYVCSPVGYGGLVNKNIENGGSIIGKILKHFFLWEKIYGAPITERRSNGDLFLIENPNSSASALYFTNPNEVQCAGPNGGDSTYNEWIYCVDSQQSLNLWKENELNLGYTTSNCSGDSYIDNANDSKILTNIINAGEIHLRVPTSASESAWAKIIFNQVSSQTISSYKSFSGCVSVTAASRSVYPATLRTDAAVGLPLSISADWRTF
jgi:hypothetical protein